MRRVLCSLFLFSSLLLISGSPASAASTYQCKALFSTSVSQRQSDRLASVTSLIVSELSENLKIGSSDFSSARARLESHGLPTTYSDLQLLGLSRSAILGSVRSVVVTNPNLEIAKLSPSKREELIDEILRNSAQVELREQVASGFEIEVFRADQPDQIETLPGEIVFAMQRLNEEYAKQSTNTVDVFSELPKLRGKTVYYFVAKDAAGSVAGLFALVIATPKSPTSLRRFGVRDLRPLQIEISKALVLNAGRHLLASFTQVSAKFMEMKKIAPETPIYFWADEPSWAAILKRMGAPPIDHSGGPNIWAFGTSVGAYVSHAKNKSAVPSTASSFSP